MLIFVGLITSTENVQKKFNVIFVISGVIASFWRVFIKFRWHGQNLTTGTPIFFTFRHHWMLDKIHILLTGSETTNLNILLLQFVGWIKGWKLIWVASQNFQSGSGLKISCGFGPFEERKWTRSHLIFIYVFQRVPIQATFCQSNLSR